MLACRVALGVTGENICTPNAAKASVYRCILSGVAVSRAALAKLLANRARTHR